MKMSNVIGIALLGIALVASPVYAQQHEQRQPWRRQFFFFVAWRRQLLLFFVAWEQFLLLFVAQQLKLFFAPQQLELFFVAKQLFDEQQPQP